MSLMLNDFVNRTVYTEEQAFHGYGRGLVDLRLYHQLCSNFIGDDP